MLNNLKNFFNKSNVKEADNENNYKLSLFCGIMIEAANVDGKIDNSEIVKIESSLVNIFQESLEDIKQVMNDCIDKINEPNSFHSYTSKINKLFTETEKIELLEILWEIVLSDGQIHEYESSLIRRLSGLLYVSDINCGNAKKRAMDKLNNKKL